TDGRFTIDVPGSELVADPDHIIDASVTSTDAAGNSSTVTTTEGYGVDTTLPTITVDVPLNTNDTTPTITGTSDAAAGTTVTIVVTDSAGNKQDLTTTVKPDGSYSVDVITPLPEGGFTADATIIDPAGNQAGASGDGIVDTTPPVGLTIVLDPNITPDDVINAAEVSQDIPVSGTVSGEFNPRDTVTLTVNGKLFTGQVDANGKFTIEVAGRELVADPDHIIDASVTSTDAAGNSNTAITSDKFDVDTTLPTITVDAPDHTHDSTPTITGTTTDIASGSTVTIVVTDAKGLMQTLTTTVNADGSYSVEVVTPLAEGGYTANATVSDAAGNQAQASDSGDDDVTPPVDLAIVLDPNITPDDVINAAEADQDIPVSGTVSGEFNPGDIVTLTVNGKLFTGQVDADGKFTIAVPGSALVAAPDHLIDASVTSTDAAGNSSTAITTDRFDVDTTLPTITVDAPDHTHDSTPTITGTTTDIASGSTVTIVVIDAKGLMQTLTTTVNADGSYSVEVVTPLAEGGYTANATVSDAAGNQAQASDSGDDDVTPPVDLAIVLDPNITPDDVINAAESGGNIPVSGTVDGEFKIGDTVTLTVNGKEFTGKVLGTDGRFTIDVPGSELVADPDHIIDA
ncbi:MAG: Ig-like domain-containing protein, partial [Aeromonas sp.]